MDAKPEKGILIGYGYQPSRRTCRSRDVIFDETCSSQDRLFSSLQKNKTVGIRTGQREKKSGEIQKKISETESGCLLQDWQ